MALIRVAQYSSTPTVVTDYQAQNAHLQAFTNQLLTQQFILDAGTAQPVIKQGCYVSHGGSLYIADADTSITGSPSDGSVYIRVSGTTSLTVEFVTDISGYTWNPVYTALTNGSYTILPYLIVKASTVWTRYNFNPNNQQFDNARIGALAVTGNTTVGGTLGVTGEISGNSIDVSASLKGYMATTEIGPNRPKDNNDSTIRSVGVGGFTYATNSGVDKYWIMIPGTWIVIGTNSSGVSKMERVDGGSTTSQYSSIVIFRIA